MTTPKVGDQVTMGSIDHRYSSYDTELTACRGLKMNRDTGHTYNIGRTGHVVAIQEHPRNKKMFYIVRDPVDGIHYIYRAEGLTVISTWKTNFKIGDYVRIKNTGKIYRWYTQWTKKGYKITTESLLPSTLEGKIGKIVEIGPHSSSKQDRILAMIELTNKTFAGTRQYVLIDVAGLRSLMKKKKEEVVQRAEETTTASNTTSFPSGAISSLDELLHGEARTIWSASRDHVSVHEHRFTGRIGQEKVGVMIYRFFEMDGGDTQSLLDRHLGEHPQTYNDWYLFNKKEDAVAWAYSEAGGDVDDCCPMCGQEL